MSWQWQLKRCSQKVRMCGPDTYHCSCEGLGFCSLLFGISFVLLTRGGLAAPTAWLWTGGTLAPSAAVCSYLCIHSPCCRSRVKGLVLSTWCPCGLGAGEVSLCCLRLIPCPGTCSQNLLLVSTVWCVLKIPALSIVEVSLKTTKTCLQTIDGTNLVWNHLWSSWVFFFSVCLYFPTHEIKIPTFPFFQLFLSVLIQSCSWMLLCHMSSQWQAEGGCQSQLGACITTHSVVIQIVDNIIIMQKRK